MLPLVASQTRYPVLRLRRYRKGSADLGGDAVLGEVSVFFGGGLFSGRLPKDGTLPSINVTVLWYGLGRPVISSEIGSWSVFVLLGWHLVYGTIMK